MSTNIILPGKWHDVIAEGSFSSKTRTSLKTQLLFMFLEHSNFPAFSLQEIYSLHSCISIICECSHIAFCFSSERPIFAVQPSKVYFSGCQFQSRTYYKSLKTRKSFEVDFLCNLRPQAKELCRHLLDSRLLAKTA